MYCNNHWVTRRAKGKCGIYNYYNELYILLFQWCNYSYCMECSVEEEGEILCSLEVVYDGGTGEEMWLC